MLDMIEIAPLRADERVAWSVLWRGYLEFYQTTLPETRYARTWARLLAGTELVGLAARDDGRMVGIAHFLFHPSAWMDDVCYLQDLFVDQTCRGQGVGRRLIEAVAEAARVRGAGRLYWTTQQDNAAATLLYDRIARFTGFIRYDYALSG